MPLSMFVSQYFTFASTSCDPSIFLHFDLVTSCRVDISSFFQLLSLRHPFTSTSSPPFTSSSFHLFPFKSFGFVLSLCFRFSLALMSFYFGPFHSPRFSIEIRRHSTGTQHHEDLDPLGAGEGATIDSGNIEWPLFRYVHLSVPSRHSRVKFLGVSHSRNRRISRLSSVERGNAQRGLGQLRVCSCTYILSPSVSIP
jgi:hypothetical protein